jgi:hypothetical protein
MFSSGLRQSSIASVLCENFLMLCPTHICEPATPGGWQARYSSLSGLFSRRRIQHRHTFSADHCLPPSAVYTTVECLVAGLVGFSEEQPSTGGIPSPVSVICRSPKVRQTVLGALLLAC